MFHINTFGKEPELAVAKVEVCDMGAGDGDGY